MFYATVLVLWLELDAGMPPTASFIKGFESFKACQDYRRSMVEKKDRDRTACLMLVVDPKEGIKE